ncbi:MAG TPA: XrtA/PEP-CTERM system histidine kinase PrsK [Burkholderiales bacterium]|nr:XrtA/PEP-CTERM system histidine kinase PrsK [Burkholderiales bacterium]
MALPVGTLGYAAAAAAFLFLSVLLVMSWRGRLPGILLAAGSLTTVAWAGATAYLIARPDPSLFAADLLEVLRTAAWLIFLMVLLGYGSKEVGRLRLFAVALVVFCGVLFAATFFSGYTFATRLGAFGIFGRLTLAVVGMILVEQLYRNVNPQQRWGIKFLCLGFGGIFACDFYLYADAQLFRRVDGDIWAARGVVNALVVPLLAIATARNPTLSLDVTISRRIVFHSTAMLGAATYLLLMALAGFYIRYFGGNWGSVLQVIFLFGAVMLLCAILFSGTLRARLKVFLSKNFFSYHYDYRDEWLRFTQTLSEGEPGTQLRERSIQAIAGLVDSPGGALWLAQESGTFELSAHWNTPSASGTEQADGALCQFLERRHWVIDLDEYVTHPELYEGLKIPESVRLVPLAWLVVPLTLHERLVGFVVLVRSQGRVKLNWEVNDLLKTAGRQAASYLAQLEAAKALLVARQFESFNRMSAFVVHDLKNLVAQLSLLLSNADRHKHEPAFQQDMIETVAHSVEKMSRLLFQLRGGYTLEAPKPVSLEELLRQVVAARSGLKPAPRLEVRDGSMSVVAHRARLERVIGHLVQNAIDATPAEGNVVVQLLRQNSSAVIEIADTGCGMSEQFIRYRLFKPFESTKAAGMGIGTYETQQYVRELGGRIHVESREARGTTFRVDLPLHAHADAAGEGVAVEDQA